jgi:hypothetical protein
VEIVFIQASFLCCNLDRSNSEKEPILAAPHLVVLPPGV